MGYRLHTQIKHEIEYGNTEAFNYAQEFIDGIISDLCDNYWANEEYCPSEYEIDKDVFKGMIDTLKEMTDEYFDANYGSTINHISASREDVIMGFENMLAECDPNNTYIYLSWF